MWPSLFPALLCAVVAGWILTAWWQWRRIQQLERKKEEIEVEETLVFDFLHGLGEAFRETIRPGDLHRLIVEGATRILDARGGALYMVDRTGAKLAPAFISKGAPPLVDVPDAVLQKALTDPAALENHLRTRTIEAGEGVVGRVWQTGQAENLSDLADAPELAKLRTSPFGSTSVMVTPLLYGKQNMGVLALGQTGKNANFTQSDFVIFKSIAEQSAFALYNAIIYSEANEKKRLDHDLQIAREIQGVLLPSVAPSFDGFEIHGLNIPARQVSGDYLDYIKVDDERLGVVIGDVSGKGVPASLIMAICRSVLRSTAPGNPSPSDVLGKVNRQLYPDIKEDMFISMAYVILDHVHNAVTLARAGHDAPLLYKNSAQTVTPVKPPGMAVGIDSGDVFDRITRDFSLELERDDCLIFYTDGVTEALNAEGDEFGLERMMRSVQQSAVKGAPAIIDRLTEEVRTFIGSEPQNDDITLIAIRKT
jgi:phosphoserine phosphatase RsbU/P